MILLLAVRAVEYMLCSTHMYVCTHVCIHTYEHMHIVYSQPVGPSTNHEGTVCMCRGCCAAPHGAICSLQANEMLLGGRKLTAQEACGKGLVSQVFWPGTFTQEVMVRIKELASCNPAVRAMSVPTSSSPNWSGHMVGGV